MEANSILAVLVTFPSNYFLQCLVETAMFSILVNDDAYYMFRSLSTATATLYIPLPNQ